MVRKNSSFSAAPGKEPSSKSGRRGASARAYKRLLTDLGGAVGAEGGNRGPHQTKSLTGKPAPFDRDSQAGYAAFGMTIEPTDKLAPTMRHGLLLATIREGGKTACHLSDGSNLLVSNVLGAHIRPSFSMPPSLRGGGWSGGLGRRPLQGSGRRCGCHDAQPRRQRDSIRVRSCCCMMPPI